MRHLAVAGVALACTLVVTSANASAPPRAPAGAFPRGGKVVATIRIPRGYGGFAVGAGSVWAVSDDASILSRIDPARNAVSARIKIVPKHPCPAFVCGEPAAGNGAVWVPRASDNSVSRVDLASNAITDTVAVGANPTTVALTPGAVWIANSGGMRNGHIEGPSVSRIDPDTKTVAATISLAPSRYASNSAIVASGPGVVWASSAGLKSLIKIDAQTNRVTARVPISELPCGHLAVDARAVWASTGHCTPTGIVRVDPRKGRQTATVTGELAPVGLVLAFGTLWVADIDRKAIDRVSIRTSRVIARLPVGGIPIRLGVGFGSIWLRDDTGRVLRIKPL